MISALVASEWCSEDNHSLYERNTGFNSWLDERGDDAEDVLAQLGLLNVATPSKALFAGDYPAYEQAAKRFLKRLRDKALGEDDFDEHWFKKNVAHFQQLRDVIVGESVVPFVGAGVSCAAGMPSWTNHLISQAKTAGILDAENRIANGGHEKLIDDVISQHGEALFLQSIRDDFFAQPDQVDLLLQILKLCKHVIVTTNYDRCIEHALSISGNHFSETIFAADTDNLALIAALSNRKRALLKLHGNVNSPSNCVLSKVQYDNAYGVGSIDMSRPLPRKLRRVFEHSSLLFVGCSLNRDRTIQVFEKVMDERGAADLPQHFAVIEAPADQSALGDRNSFLTSVGITPIWYQHGYHFRIVEILSAIELSQ